MTRLRLPPPVFNVPPQFPATGDSPRAEETSATPAKIAKPSFVVVDIFFMDPLREVVAVRTKIGRRN